MIKPHTYEYVWSFIRNTSGCTLVSKEYKNNSTKLLLRCSCGNEFQTTFSSFSGTKNLRVCPKCNTKIRAMLQRYTEEEVDRFVSENSDCEYISGYENAKSKMLLRCGCGKLFNVNFNNFQTGKRYCNACRPSVHNKYSEEQVRQLVQRESDCTYVSGYTVSTEKFRIRCGCGEEFETLLSNFRAGKKQCDLCSGKISKGEKQIERWLIQNAVDYEKQKRFKDCRHRRSLPFDFFLPRHNLCIEYDGEQHYREDRFAVEGSLQEVQRRDAIKDRYCESAGINLLRIPYKDYLRIDDILHSHVNTEVSK